MVSRQITRISHLEDTNGLYSPIRSVYFICMLKDAIRANRKRVATRKITQAEKRLRGLWESRDSARAQGYTGDILVWDRLIHDAEQTLARAVIARNHLDHTH